jgi:hypothetical protein
VRQVLGAIAEFDKAMTVAKLKGARDRKSAEAGRRIEGRKGFAVTHPEAVALAKRLRRASPKTGERRSLRAISALLAKPGTSTSTAARSITARSRQWSRARGRRDRPARLSEPYFSRRASDKTQGRRTPAGTRSNAWLVAGLSST